MVHIPTIIAHRGASGYAPENTFVAFDRALELGFPDIEFDVRVTKDGMPIILHDTTIDRTTNGSGAVAEMTLARLQKLDAGAWFGADFAGQRVPTLEEVLARYRGRARFQVEIKATSAGLEKKAVILMRRYGVLDSCIVTSFEPSAIRKSRRLSEPGLRVRWLVSRLDLGVVEKAARMGVSGVNVYITALTPEVAKVARSRGLAVGAWGCDGEEHIANALRCDVDSFTHNYPDVAKKQLQRLVAEAK